MSPDDFESFFLNESDQQLLYSDFISSIGVRTFTSRRKGPAPNTYRGSRRCGGSLATTAQPSSARPGNHTVPSAVLLKKAGLLLAEYRS